MREKKESMEFTISELYEFLSDYTCSSPPAPAPPTLMEVAGFPHWENVYSNILAFFLDGNNPHGFSDLMVRALLQAYHKKTNRDEDIEPVDSQPEIKGIETICVEREAGTDDAKRLDILVEAGCPESKGFIIGIENKIWSPVHNDLAAYKRLLEKRKGERTVIPILLSPYVKKEGKISDNGFVNITYGELMGQVACLLGEYLGTTNQQYQYLLLDFIEQGRRFERRIEMTDEDRKFIEFWHENEAKIQNIRERTDALWNQMNGKAKQYQDEVRNRLEEAGILSCFELWVFQKTACVFDLANDHTVEGARLYLDVYMEPLGIKQTFWSRNKRPIEKLAKEILTKSPELSMGTHHNRPALEPVFSPFTEVEWQESLQCTLTILKRIAERIDK
jgi:hypothetical protein